jgi:hypothetical protein
LLKARDISPESRNPCRTYKIPDPFIKLIILMKSSVVFFLILLSSISLFAQKQTTDNVTQKFVTQFNKKKFDDIYNSFSDSYQKSILKKDLHSYLNQIYDMTGPVKSAKFITFKDGIYQYYLIAKNNDVNADFLLTIDQNYKIGYINFSRIGGSGNPPPMGKMN